MSRSICVLLVLTAVGASLIISAESGPSARAKASGNVPKKLLEQRLDAARNVFRMNLHRLQSHEAISDEGFLSWSEHWLDAELALGGNQEDRIAAFKAHLERAKELEKVAAIHAKTGQGRESDAQAATYFRVDAEIRLLQATAE